MEESTLRNMAILSAIVGLGLLFLVSIQIQECTNIGSISIDDVGKGFKTCGTITAKSVSNNHIFFDIQDETGKIKLVIFNSTAIKLNETGLSPYSLKKGNTIHVTGIADEYPKGTGRLELIYRSGNIEVY